MSDNVTCPHCGEVSNIGGLIGPHTNNCPRCGGVVLGRQSHTDTMTAAYIEALYFTETGEEGQPSPDEPLHPDTKREAWAACHRLRLACSGHDGIDLAQYDPAQVGHDLWLTRNGHGVGFWDRPEVYGEENARILTLMAKAMGEHYAEFGE